MLVPTAIPVVKRKKMKIPHQNGNLARLKIPFYEPVENVEVQID